jgi:hypothetical protein
MIECLHPGLSASRTRVVLFDFDGTLSLLRAGWMDVMVSMMLEVLAELKTGESETELELLVKDYVARLTGKQTIYQMIELANQVKSRGGQPLEPLAYKKLYHDRLMEKIRDRREALRTARNRPRSILFRALGRCSIRSRRAGSGSTAPAALTTPTRLKRRNCSRSRPILMAASTAHRTTTRVSQKRC